VPGARAAVVADYARRGVELDVNQVVLTASSSESYALLFKLLGDPGQTVLCPEPSYPLFEYLARLESLNPRPYRLRFDGLWHIDFPILDLTDVAAIILVSPNNPTGSFVSREDFDRLAGWRPSTAGAYCRRGIRRLPAVAVCRGAHRCRGPGLARAGVLAGRAVQVVRLAPPQAGLDSGHGAARLGPRCTGAPGIDRRHVPVSGTPVQMALPGLLQAGAAIRRQILERVQRNRQALAKALGAHSPCTLLPQRLAGAPSCACRKS